MKVKLGWGGDEIGWDSALLAVWLLGKGPGIVLHGHLPGTTFPSPLLVSWGQCPAMGLPWGD